MLRVPLERKGYRYHNLDQRSSGDHGTMVIGDAHRLPFKERAFDLIVSNDSFEHFLRPQEALLEIRRVLVDNGTLVIQVPFMHPFHGNDTYRFTPLGLRYLLGDVAGLDIVRLESPLWVFSLLTYLFIPVLKKVGLGFLERPIRAASRVVDGQFTRRMSGPSSSAAAYVVVARKSMVTRS